MNHYLSLLDSLAALSNKSCMNIGKYHQEYASLPGGVFNKQT